jgi:flagellar basal-body rod modification protein FlgD
MTIAAVGSTATTATAASNIGLQDFMKILLTHLTYQDPLKPMDNQEFLAQMAQFTAVEQSQQLNERLQQLIDNQAAQQSIGLIGRNVDITTATGNLTGTVSALTLQGASPVLSLILPGGNVMNDVSLSQLIAVR